MLELVVSTGDPQGIGPEVSEKAAKEFLESHPSCRIVLVGDPGLFEAELPDVGQDLEGARLQILPVPFPRPLTEAPPSPAGGAAALASLKAAFERVRERPGRALVTAPLSKVAVASHGVPFTGHTEWLAEELQSPSPLMLFCAPGLRVALATVHVALKDVPARISAGAVLRSLRTFRQGLKERFGVEEPRLAVLGLNPHAGEGGLLGREEIEAIRPQMEAFRREGGLAFGPFSADSFFQPRLLAGYHGVLAMYHDQGLLPLKALSFGEAVNVTLGIPMIRTSVDHGCAYDLAQTGRADPKSMLAALRLAHTLLLAPN